MLKYNKLSSKGGDQPFRDIYTFANDPGYQIFFKSVGLQKIPGPDMVTLSAIEEWNKLKKLGIGFTHFFSDNARVISFCFCTQILQL